MNKWNDEISEEKAFNLLRKKKIEETKNRRKFNRDNLHDEGRKITPEDEVAGKMEQMDLEDNPNNNNIDKFETRNPNNGFDFTEAALLLKKLQITPS